jgi:hypothetical protein
VIGISAIGSTHIGGSPLEIINQVTICSPGINLPFIGGGYIGGSTHGCPHINQVIIGNARIDLSLLVTGYSDVSDSNASATTFLTIKGTGKIYSPDPLWLKSVVPQFIPAHIFEDHPRFVELLEQYCDTIEKRYGSDNNESIGAYYPIKYFDQLVDLDDTRDDLLEWFKRTFAVTIPQFTSADTRLLIKNAVRFYVSRGTKDSISFLLNTFFGDATATVYEPKVDLFRASDGRWSQPNVIALTDFSDPLTPVSGTVLSSIFDQELINELTLAQAYVGQATTHLGTPVIELIDKFGLFKAGDVLRSSDGRQWIVHTLGLVKLPGKWLTTDSFASSDKRLQDSFFWQDFSYQIITQRTIGEISDAIAKNTHPAGLLNFVKTKLISNIDYDENLNVISILIQNFNYILDEDSFVNTTSTMNLKIEDHMQAFTDWSEFILDISAGYNLSNAVTMGDLEHLAGSDIDSKLSQSHVLFNWGQRYAAPYLVPGQNYISPVIDEAIGQSVRVSLEDFPMAEFDDVPLEYLEKVQLSSINNHVGFETFTLTPNQSNFAVFNSSGTAPRSDRTSLSVIVGKPYEQVVLDQISGDTGYLDANRVWDRPVTENLAGAIFPNSGVEILTPTGRDDFMFYQLASKKHNAIVYTSEGKVLYHGYDYHITDDYLVIEPKYALNDLVVHLFNKCQVTPSDHSATFNSWYNAPKPLEQTWLDFSKSVIL